MLRPISRFARGQIALIAGAMVLASCRSEAEPAAPPTPAPTASETAAGAREVAEETPIYLFEYSWPEEAGRVPELAAFLETRLTRQRAGLEREAQQGLEAARDNGFPYNKYSTGTAWKLEADLPRYLSLSAEISAYSGGAHPNYGFDALVWDKQGAAPLAPADFFVSPEALEEALGERFCAALDAERQRRRASAGGGEGAEGGADGGAAAGAGAPGLFDDCVALSETTLVLASASGRAFDRIAILIGPYVAGPYAEGSYQLRFNVDAAVLEAVKPEHREVFAARN